MKKPKTSTLGHTVVETVIAVLLMAVVGLAATTFITVSSRTLQSVSTGSLNKLYDSQEIYQTMASVGGPTGDSVVLNTFGGMRPEDIVVGLEIVPMKSADQRLFSEIDADKSPKFIVASVSDVDATEILAHRGWSFFNEAYATGLESAAIISPDWLFLDTQLKKVGLDYNVVRSDQPDRIVRKRVPLGLEIYLASARTQTQSDGAAPPPESAVLMDALGPITFKISAGFTKATLREAKKECAANGEGHKIRIENSAFSGGSMTNVVLGIAAGGYRSQMVKGWSSRFSNAGINCLAEQCPAGQYAVACIDAGSIVSKGEFFPPERIRCVDAGRYRKNNKFDWARACWDLRMETVFSCEGTEKTPAVVCDPGQICNRNNLACLSNGVAVTSGTLASSPDIVSPINAAAVPTDSGEKGGDTQLGASTDNKATDHKE